MMGCARMIGDTACMLDGEIWVDEEDKRMKWEIKGDLMRKWS